MGKGDKKTGKGKRFRGSYGKTRPRKSSAPVIEVKPKAKPKKKKATTTKAATEKPAAKKTTTKKAPAKKKTEKAEA